MKKTDFIVKNNRNQLLIMKTKKNLLCLITIIILTSFLFVTIAFGAALTPISYYVDINSVGGKSSDTNIGTDITKPFLTFSKAISVAKAGDTIYFRKGTYAPIIVTKSGVQNSYLTIRNFPNELVVIDGVAGASEGIRLKETKYVEINGFEVKNISNSNYTGGILVVGNKGDISGVSSSYNRIINNVVHDNKPIAPATNWVYGIIIQNSSYNLIQNNTTYNNQISGIKINGGSTSVGSIIVKGNQIIGNRSYSNLGMPENADGIGLEGLGVSETLIKDNIVYNNGDDGIDTWNTSGNIIEGNIAYNQSGPGDGNGFKMGGSTTGGNNIVRYNISYCNKTNGFDSNGSGGNKYYNNVAYMNGHIGFVDLRNTGAMGYPNSERYYGTFINNIGIENGIVDGYKDDTDANFYPSSATKISNYNIWFHSTKGAYIKYNSTIYSDILGFQNVTGLDKKSISKNPLFTNPFIKDFHLQSTSPAINTGDPLNPGTGAISGGISDIGRFEFTLNN